VELTRRKITDLVDENYVYAYALYYLGIRFYEYPEDTLEQVCRHRGLDVAQVIRRLESVASPRETNPLPLHDLPVDLVIEYLKHTHHLFIRHKLPYIARLIETLDPPRTPLTDDLRTVFPLFVEDFIHHIHDEEDTLFRYIALLHRARHRKVNPGRLYYQMEKHSIQRYAMDHDTHDDEMRGIREITNGYTPEPAAGQRLRVIFLELQAFEQELQTHARIENEILFPKALLLESEIKQLLGQATKMN